MAIVVTDTRTVITVAESLTGWTGTSLALSPSIRVEGTNAVVGTLNIATGQNYLTITSSNWANSMVYAWSNNYALQASWLATAPPHALYLSDGTNAISFRMAGSDRKVFSHLTSQDWGWDCLLLDTSQGGVMDAAGTTVIRGGSFASFNSASITRVGSDFTTLSKGLGGGTNVGNDIIRVGNNGIRISSGSALLPGSFVDIVVQDRSTASLNAHGIIREYTSGLYGCQGPLNFGAGLAVGTWFSDSNFTLVFEDRNVSNDKYYIAVSGSAASETSLVLDNGTIATAGPWASFDFSSDRISNLSLTNMTFRGLSGSMTFGTDVTASLYHAVNTSTIVRSGKIFVNAINFDNDVVIDSGQVIPTSGTLLGTEIRSSRVGVDSGSLLWNIDLNPDGKLDDMIFTRGTFVNHAIEFGPNCPTSMSLTGLTFTSYGASSTPTASLYNNSAKALHITIANGLEPTVRNGTAASTTIIAGLIDVSLTGLVSGSEVRILDNVTQNELDGIESTATTPSTFTFSLAQGNIVDMVIHNVEYEYIRINEFTIPATNASIPIEQRFDRNYANPT